jgi:ABC-type multidrug transport system fused ATPase/permease subunit
VNRMANDMMNVDMQVFVGCCSTIGVVFSLCVPLYYVHLQMPLWFTLLTAPFYYSVVYLIILYWKTMVPLRYLMQVSKSAVSSEVADVETTPASVRAYQMQEERVRQFTLAVRKMIASDFLGRIICIRWLCNRLFVLGGCFLTGVSLICLWLPLGMDVGSASLVINTMFQLICGIEGTIHTGSQAQYQIIAMNRVYEYTSLPEEREDELPQDKTFQNSAVTLSRSKLGELESRRTPQGLQIYARGQEMDPLLLQHPGTPHFVAAKGRSLGELEPTNLQLRKCEPWHRLVTVNSAHETADEIAEELCYGDSPEVIVHCHSGWLVDGVKVELKNLRAGYADVPKDVLHSISLVIPRRSKCGVCGPTGCGKSTLLLSLLRMLEPRDGTIYLEGVDTQTIGLRTLRMAMGLVPQDPVLLQGSLRFNIDPFEFFDEARIWEALRLVHLDDFVKDHLKGGLDFQVSGEGANLSFGQRQLLSLARNIVRKPMLLLLDEATSAIDPHTQELLQNTIESKFPDSTMVVIAHRLETILDFDMAVVMDKGRIAEKGPLKELAKVKNGKFAKMLAAKGLSVSDGPNPTASGVTSSFGERKLSN